MSPNTASTGGVRRALIIGINAYAVKPLFGCVNDAKRMAALLGERFGFADEHITLLLDGGASLAAVMQAMEQLVQVTQPEDTVCFFFAGHGTVSEQTDGTEATGSGTTFCLQEDPREDIYDDDFGVWLDRLATRTENVTLLIDCCHSATITRGDDDGGVSLPQVRRTGSPAPDRRPPSRGGTGRGFTTLGSRSHTLIAACRDDQLAAETTVDPASTERCGILSLVLCRELRAATTGDTWRDIFDRVAPQVTEIARLDGGNQHPQIDGRDDRVLFGLDEFAPVSPVRVVERSGDTVVIDAGALHGVTKGTVFAIFGAGAKAGSDEPTLGRVQVTAVRGTTSQARILGEAEPQVIAAGARAVSSAQDSFATALAIDNHDAGSTLRGKVTLALMRVGSDDEFAPIDASADGSAAGFASGERIALRISNGTAVPVFVNLFYFSPSGTITELAPSAVKLVPAGGVFSIGTVGADDVGALAPSWEGEPATAWFKLFASTSQVNLSYLERLGESARESDGLELSTIDDWTAVTVPVTLLGDKSSASSEGIAPTDTGSPRA